MLSETFRKFLGVGFPHDQLLSLQDVSKFLACALQDDTYVCVCVRGAKINLDYGFHMDSAILVNCTPIIIHAR